MRRDKEKRLNALERDERAVNLSIKVPFLKALNALKQSILEAFQTGDTACIMKVCQERLTPLLMAQTEVAYLKGGRRAQLSSERVIKESTLEFAPVRFSLGDADDSTARGVADYLQKISGIDPSQFNDSFQKHNAGAIGDLSVAICDEVKKALIDLSEAGIHVKGGKSEVAKTLIANGVKATNLGALAETLFRTHTQQAYSAGRWSAVEDSDVGDYIWGFEYVTAHDPRVREGHRVLEGVRLPKEDPFWEKYFPPNGWNCRCTTLEIWKDDDDARIDFGITGRDPRTRTPEQMDITPEFVGNVGLWAKPENTATMEHNSTPTVITTAGGNTVVVDDTTQTEGKLEVVSTENQKPKEMQVKRPIGDLLKDLEKSVEDWNGKLGNIRGELDLTIRKKDALNAITSSGKLASYLFKKWDRYYFIGKFIINNQYEYHFAKELVTPEKDITNVLKSVSVDAIQGDKVLPENCKLTLAKKSLDSLKKWGEVPITREMIRQAVFELFPDVRYKANVTKTINIKRSGKKLVFEKVKLGLLGKDRLSITGVQIEKIGEVYIVTIGKKKDSKETLAEAINACLEKQGEYDALTIDENEERPIHLFKEVDIEERKRCAESFKEVKSKAEAVDTLNTVGIEVVFRDDDPLDFVQGVTQAVGDMVAMFPELRCEKIAWMDASESVENNYIGYADQLTTEVRISRQNLSHNVDELKSYRKEAVESGFKVSEHPFATIHHELGHQAEHYLMFNPDVDWSKYCSRRDALYKEAKKLRKKMEDKDILSEYGLSDPSEMVAEAFSDYIVNGDNSKDLTKAVIKLWKEFARGTK